MGAVEAVDAFVHDGAHGGNRLRAVAAGFAPVHIHSAPPKLAIGHGAARVDAMRVKDHAQARIKVILLPVQTQAAGVAGNLDVGLRRWLEPSRAAKFDVPED